MVSVGMIPMKYQPIPTEIPTLVCNSNAVAREWFQELREGGDYKEWELDKLMSTFFAIFYVDDAYLASRDVEFLQRVLDLLVSLFAGGA